MRSPTRTSTWANTRGNFTSTVTGGAGAGATRVTINIPGHITMAHPGYHPETAGLTDTIKSASPLVKDAAVGLAIGFAVDLVLESGKHKVLGAMIGAGLGILYAKASATPPSPSA